MSHTDVYGTLSSAGVPVAHMAWPKGSAPSLPWMVYMASEDATFRADSCNYAPATTWTAELYEEARDGVLEDAVEHAIAEAYGTFTRYETWIDSENCLEVVYTFTEIEREQNG